MGLLLSEAPELAVKARFGSRTVRAAISADVGLQLESARIGAAPRTIEECQQQTIRSSTVRGVKHLIDLRPKPKKIRAAALVRRP